MGNQPYNGNYGQNHQPPPPPQNYGPQQHQVPPPPPPQPQYHAPPHKPKGFPKAILAIIIIVVVVVVVIIAALLLFGNDQGSPEDVVRAYYEEAHNSDVQDLTISHFSDNTYELVSIDDVEYKMDLSDDEVNSIEDTIDYYEDEYNIKITSYAKVEITMRETYEGDIDTYDTTLWVFEIGGDWYIGWNDYY